MTIAGAGVRARGASEMGAAMVDMVDSGKGLTLEDNVVTCERAGNTKLCRSILQECSQLPT
jgi:hypothetical protein